MATKFIQIVHPEVGEATVPESSLPHHMKAGWRRVDETDQQQEIQQETQQASPRRRRTENSEES